jgi:cation diffusion facilitator family transporter
MADDSPPRPKSYRIGSLRGFLPLSDSDSTFSTRGQALPSLIQSRSSANIKELRTQALHRRSETPETNGDEDHDNEADADGGGTGHGGPSPAKSWLGRGGRRMSAIGDGGEVLMTPQMRSMRLIGNSNPRYRWEQYYKSDEELKTMKKPVRRYYERNNHLISSYLYIDRLLDSSLPHSLIQEYNHGHDGNGHMSIPNTITEEQSSNSSLEDERHPTIDSKPTANGHADQGKVKLKRTPKALYKLPDENTPLLGEDIGDGPKAYELQYGEDDDAQSGSKVVTVAIYVNLAANAVLLAGKIAVIVLTSSLSVLASLVDAALDFLSTAIVWVTTKLISRQDQHSYPVGRRRLEPLGVLVFSVIMITSFFQVLLQCFNRLTGPDHTIVQLGIPAIVIMATTVFLKLGCWFWCRLIKNSSVQALAQDAMTDVVFNIFSIIFPLVGYYASLWWLDALGGLLLSLYVIVNWSRTSNTHIQHLTGAAAPAADRNILLYLTMRFAKTIKSIQGLQAYHAGDKLNVEVDVVLDEGMTLRDSHDLGESLQYVLESVPSVDRAFVHLDYAGYNLPSHMQQQAE